MTISSPFLYSTYLYQAIAGEYIGLGHRLNNSRYLSTTSVFSLGLTANYEGVQVSHEIPVQLLPLSLLWWLSLNVTELTMVFTIVCCIYQALDDTLDGVPVRLYEPKNRAKNTPALIWIHGGGWVGKAAGELCMYIYISCFFSWCALLHGQWYMLNFPSLEGKGICHILNMMEIDTPSSNLIN